MVEQEQRTAAAQVHPHPIRWDAEAQLWVCTNGCGFTRPKREGEVLPSREEARQEAQRAGTGADFADLAGRATRPGQGARPGAAGTDGASGSAPGGAQDAGAGDSASGGSASGTDETGSTDETEDDGALRP